MSRGIRQSWTGVFGRGEQRGGGSELARCVREVVLKWLREVGFEDEVVERIGRLVRRKRCIYLAF